MQYFDLRYAPDIDSSWSVNPGALTAMNGFAPMQSGTYATNASNIKASGITGSDHQVAMMFRQINGTVRFLTFRDANIDEYSSSYVRTNRGTGYTSTYAMWSAASWGNQIIACSLSNATQSSTGAGFSALGGSSPKARMVAANVNFVMMADVDDGASNVYSDMVWWCGIRNPASWSPSIATQAGRVRLLDAPGPIRALVSFRNTFVAFKDNAIFVGEYIGPPYVFAWRLVSTRVGCVGQNAVGELDGKLYFLHSSGFWEFDGQSLRNIGTQVFQSYASESGFLSGLSGDCVLPSGRTSYGISKTQVAVDDAEGVVWFSFGDYVGTTEFSYLYGYNPRCQKWARTAVQTATNITVNVYQTPLVKATTSDIQAFAGGSADRFWMIFNDSSTSIRAFAYPNSNVNQDFPTITTGLWGAQEQSTRTGRLWLRHRKGTNSLSASDVTGSAVSYTDESRNTSASSVTGTYNTELATVDMEIDGRYKTATIQYSKTKNILLAGIGLDEKLGGKR